LPLAVVVVFGRLGGRPSGRISAHLATVPAVAEHTEAHIESRTHATPLSLAGRTSGTGGSSAVVDWRSDETG